ncbi:MAG: hypothetical protein NT166_08820 [Candidatus Aminicenantes bacterium]|nr:hypothetical protein [Candidatus Aminicenantes bacterium]
MKKIFQLKYYVVVVAIVLNTSLWAEDIPNDLIIRHPTYKGVIFTMSGYVIKEYKDLTIKPSPDLQNRPKRIYRPEEILGELQKRFTEMADTYDKADKSVLPSCLRKKLDEFLPALKSGEKGLAIWWWKKTDIPWQYLRGDSDLTGTAKKWEIRINDAFLEKFYTLKDENGNYMLTEVLTSASLFHELVHTVKKNYPECFKELEVQNLEEISADWAARKIFGEKVTKTVYIDASGDQETDMCTYKIVCKCDCEDKSGRKFREQASADSGDGCEPDPPEGPAGDQPDDNYSYFRGIIKEYNLAPEALIFTSGHWQAALNLLGGLDFDENNTAEKLLKVTPFVVIPTGALSSMENDSTFKYILEQYVNLGGSIIVFAQQYDTQIDNVVPVPEGESLKTYGWRQDSSCLKNSVFFKSVHPVLSSSTNELIDAGVDGYFSVYPPDSTILLKRKINLEPALLYYPYGNGTVILTSMFTDFAAAHSQATTAEIKIIRDLITFAKNPRMPIPMFDLEQNPTPAINLNVEVKNNTELTASKAILKVYTPDRTTLLHELEAPLSLNPGIKDDLRQWLTVKDENVYWGQDVECTIHFKNTTTETMTLDFNNPYFNIDHDRFHIPFPSFQVNLPPGGEYQHNISMPTTQFNPYYKSSFTIRFQAYDANGVLKPTAPAKTIFLLGTITNSALKLNTPSPVEPKGNIFDDLQRS